MNSLKVAGMSPAVGERSSAVTLFSSSGMYAHREALALTGTVIMAALIGLGGQFLVLNHDEMQDPLTTVELLDLPPVVEPAPQTPPPPPPAAPPVPKSAPPIQAPPVKLASTPLRATENTVSMADRPPETPRPAEAVATPVAPAPAAVEAPPAKPVVEPIATPRSNPAAEGTYRSAARAGIEKQKRYPEEAQQMNMSGAVTLVYVVSREGRLVRVEVEKSSGYAMLDRAAMDAVRRARFEPMPADAWVGTKEQTFRTVIDFSLN